eukprot:CAMPEP_0194155308 /NCGR_PEP_ID=MMETSP0152-20130528/63983_1 /TAXON_ID=1049557 /ORGANISM="Thalassiothrix antarctica, Strain L6-D1" /LENGTH=166 /DNA_ID=CAMNT_0038862055 /DNA_START=92 /DNA_END=592 /DNA_ORIENTATION=-
MACALIRPPKNKNQEDSELLERIISVTNNTAVYKERDSDNHAEINAIGEAAKYGRPTLDATAVITMPPCKRCFGALLSSGISQIVTTKPLFEPLCTVAERKGVKTFVMDLNAATERISHFIPPIDRSKVLKEREIRKKEERERKLKRKLVLQKHHEEQQQQLQRQK